MWRGLRCVLRLLAEGLGPFPARRRGSESIDMGRPEPDTVAGGSRTEIGYGRLPRRKQKTFTTDYTDGTDGKESMAGAAGMCPGSAGARWDRLGPRLPVDFEQRRFRRAMQDCGRKRGERPGAERARWSVARVCMCNHAKPVPCRARPHGRARGCTGWGVPERGRRGGPGAGMPGFTL
jgi:hypothetical protein